MSWESYTDTLIRGGLSGAVILGLDGSVWAQQNVEINPAEAKSLIDGFTNSATIVQNGLRVSGQKYFYLQGDDTQIQCKKGQCGISCARSIQCVLVGIYDENINPGAARTAVEKLKDYLCESGY